MRQYLQPAGLILIFLWASLSFAQQVKAPVKPDNQQNMVSKEETEPRWKLVDSLTQRGLPQSALKVVAEIMLDAQKKSDHPQFLKANLYELKLRSWFEENYLINYITEREKLLAGGTIVEPASQILHSILGDLYWQYYSMNRYAILDRTVLGDEPTDGKLPSIDTWDVNIFIRVASEHFNLSLKNPGLLQSISLKQYNPILEHGENSLVYRPTLFDFLANRAVDFFMNEEASITKPVYLYVMKDPKLLSDARTFANLEFDSKDSLSFHLQALKIFQQILKFHISDMNDHQPLVDADLKRLDFVYRNINNPDKDSLYLNSLLALEKKFSNNPVAAMVMEKIAHYYYDAPEDPVKVLRSTITPEVLPRTVDYLKAKEWCRKVINTYPETIAAENCRIMLRQIEKPSIEFKTNEVVIPGEEFPILITYRNVKKVWFRLIGNKDLSEREIYSDRERIIRELLDAVAVKAWSENIPDNGDHKTLKTELILPPLPAGQYILIASPGQDFNRNDSIVAYSPLQVSNLSYISRNASDGSGLFYVLSRKDGKPVKGVDVQSYTMNYDYRSRKYSRQNRERYTTRENGSFTIKAPGAGQNANLSFEFRYKRDTLVAANYYALYDRGRYRGERESVQTYFFTDRAIYRPGQPVYFKGTVIKNSNNETDKRKQSVILTGHNSTVTLYDVNGQKLSSLEVTSGDYGSFSGSFMLPSSGLTGQMRIQNENGSVYFTVEEYKRPKFEVTFKEIDSTYRLNQDVDVIGEALSYSGAALSDATVNYRVVRNIVYPFYRMGYLYQDFRIWPPYKSAAAEITNGTSKVNQDGTFKISFKAIPDPDNYGMEYQHYTFEVYADVTDINGETQSGQTAINISNKALILSSDIPEKINAKEVTPVTVKSTNLNGKKVPASVKVELHKLKDGDLLVPRTWDIPDTLMYTREVFKSRLPNYPYMDEIEKQQNWSYSPSEVKAEKEKLIWSTTLNTIKDSIITLKDLKLEPGRYLLTLSSTDKFGTPVSMEKQVMVFNPDSKKLPVPQYLWFSVLNDKPQKGESIKLLAGSAVDGRLLIELQSNGKILKHEWYNITGQQILDFKLPDSLTGQVSILATLVYNNYNFIEQHDLTIEDNSQKLDFVFESFRSPLLPGGTEKWKIKITDADGKPLQAELLASMYDASLDAFVKHQWYFNLYQAWEQRFDWELRQAFVIRGSLQIPERYYEGGFNTQEYDQLNWFGYNTFNYYNGGGMRYDKVGRSIGYAKADAQELQAVNAGDFSEQAPSALNEVVVSDSNIPQETPQPQIRRNLQETAFFYPQLVTDKDGELWIEFTVPEALTRWNFMGFAHTADLRYNQFSKEVVTQKQLMVTPNLPRFFRDGDDMVLRSKINNLTSNPMQGEATLELIDAMTMEPVDAAFANNTSKVAFDLKQNGNTIVEWKVKVPAEIQMVMVRIVAKAGNYSDGEEVMLPVLTNRMMVTETLPLPINGKQTKKFEFKKLLELNTSTGSTNNTSITLIPQRLTLEFTSNPAWYALQALPWLESQEKENSDQIFNRYYANSIAAHIANSSPKIRSVFESWRNQTPEALLSNLEKNQELKAMIIEETPWLAEAKNESDQKRRIAIMFDLNRIAAEKSSALRRLQQNQSVNGGWPWFEGMPESRYITQWILTGMGKLNHISVIDLKTDSESKQMVQKAMNYLSEQIKEDYERLLKDSVNYKSKSSGRNKKETDDKYLDNDHLGYDKIQFLYALSYLTGIAEPTDNAKEAIAFYSEQARKYWNNKGLYAQAMIALWAGRIGDKKTAAAIMASLREKAITNEEMGTYWRDNAGGYFWYQAPVETQAILIELFEELGAQVGGKAMGKADGTNDVSNEVDRMKTWLLKQKQTQSWPTTTATAEAVYALLLRGTDWLQTKPSVIIKAGSELMDFTAGKIPGVQTEAGTGYFKTSWSGKEIKPDMGNITVAKSDAGTAWGAMYFQYLENLDKIEAAGTPLSVSKEIFVKEFTPEGERLKKITSENQLNVGDQLTVRVEIRSDRDLEFVHLKDMRAAAFEPVTTVSGYHWKGGLGYYQSTRDASTNFFISWLPKGTHVFEYRLVVAQSGEFSNGITTIQCMYAPEFAAHSEGIRVKVVQK